MGLMYATLSVYERYRDECRIRPI